MDRVTLRLSMEKERLVHSIAQRIRESLDLQVCLQTTVDEVRQFLRADRVLVYCFNPEWNGHVPVESVAPNVCSMRQRAVKDPSFGQPYKAIFRTSQPHVVSDIYQTYPQSRIDFLSQFKIRAKLIVPVPQGDIPWGLLMVHQCNEPRVWREWEIDLLQQLATQVAIAVRQAQLYTQAQQQLEERSRIGEALARARDEALAAARTKSDFLAVMSHEIRTPLNGIIGMLGLLRDSPLNAQQQEYATIAHECSDNLLSLVNSILDFSKLESNKLELEAQPFYIQSCVEEAINMLSSHAAKKQLRLTYKIQESVPPRIVGDTTRLRQILVNLLSNAVKFTEKGSVHLTVKAVTKKGSTCRLRFSVQDTGVGIAAEKFDRLFQSFSQADSSISRQYGGTGLGLAISHRLCKLMNGRIWVRSVPNKGSCFSFEVQVDIAATQSIELAGKRALLIEADSTVRSQLCAMLEKWQVTCCSTYSSYVALGLMNHEEPFDVAIVNYQSTDMDSWRLVQSLRALEPHLPVIILSEQSIPYGLGKQVTLTSQGIEDNFEKEFRDAMQQCLLETLSKATPLLNAKLAQRYPLKILVAEDNVVNQQLVCQWLGKMGYKPDVVSNGQKVINALSTKTYDVILMDVHMPKMDGLSATKVIREQCAPAQQPLIVAMTANAIEGDRQRCLDSGMDDYLSKPVSVKAFGKLIERCGYERHCAEDCAEDSTEDGAEDSVRESAEEHTEDRVEKKAEKIPEATTQKRLKEKEISKEKDLIDYAVLETAASAFGGLSRSWLLQFISAYELQGHELTAQMHAQSAKEDIFYAAHTLKSSSAALGLRAVTQACQAVEASSRKDYIAQPSRQLSEQLSEQLPGQIAELKRIFLSSLIALKALAERLPA